MKKKLRVGVLFGGRSGEHEVSLLSAASILKSIDRRKFDIVPIGITKEGHWLGGEGGGRAMRAAGWRGVLRRGHCGPEIPRRRWGPSCCTREFRHCFRRSRLKSRA